LLVLVDDGLGLEQAGDGGEREVSVKRLSVEHYDRSKRGSIAYTLMHADNMRKINDVR